jgi:hypothetical protein
MAALGPELDGREGDLTSDTHYFPRQEINVENMVAQIVMCGSKEGAALREGMEISTNAEIFPKFFMALQARNQVRCRYRVFI